MFGIFIYDLIFFAVPAALLVFFGVSLYRYRTAVKQNKRTPDTFPPEEIKKRKTLLIISSVTAAVLVAVVVGFIAMLFMAIAFM